MVRFTVPGKAVGKNAAYLRLREDVVTNGGRHMGLILTTAGRNYKALVHTYGLLARNQSDWPRNSWIPKSVRITVAMYGTRHDAGAATQLIKDALEGVYYQNDRIVSHGPEEPSVRDGSSPRVDVLMELLECRSPEEVQERMFAFRKRRKI
jgi:hypothetical protein